VTVRILAIAGSLRAGSHNRELVRLAGEVLPPGAELVVWEGLREVPPFDEDGQSDTPPAVASLGAAVEAADAVLIATPEYNGSIPGALKNALDWASRPAGASVFRGKPTAVIGASLGSFGGVWAQAELRKVLGLMGARVVDVELALGHADTRLAEPDAELRERLAETLRLLVAEAQPVSAAA
jgi:chromate reductase, NAD(P)H dehydrogenase (quinone)